MLEQIASTFAALWIMSSVTHVSFMFSRNRMGPNPKEGFSTLTMLSAMVVGPIGLGIYMAAIHIHVSKDSPK